MCTCRELTCSLLELFVCQLHVNECTDSAVSHSPSHKAATYHRPPVCSKQSADPRSGTAADPCQMSAGPPLADGGLLAPLSATKTHRSAAPGHSLTQRVSQVHPNNIVHEEQRGWEGQRMDLRTAAHCWTMGSMQQLGLHIRHDCWGGGRSMVAQTEMLLTLTKQCDLLKCHWARHCVPTSSVSLSHLLMA